MLKIEYQLGLNDDGRPFIELFDDYEQKPEDRFFAIEIVRYIIQDLLRRRTVDLSEDTTSKLDATEKLLTQISDEIAILLYNDMKLKGNTQLLTDVKYHVVVNSFDDINKLPETDIIYNDCIFDRVVGLRVMYISYASESITPIYNIYELQDGIENENWVKI